MNEKIEQGEPEATVEKETAGLRVRALAEVLAAERRVMAWPGIDPESYRIQKREEEEFPGFVTPIDEIIERCEQEGIRVYMVNNPRNLDVYIIPAGSSDPQQDSLLPRHLAPDPLMDESLAEIVELSKLLK